MRCAFSCQAVGSGNDRHNMRERGTSPWKCLCNHHQDRKREDGATCTFAHTNTRLCIFLSGQTCVGKRDTKQFTPFSTRLHVKHQIIQQYFQWKQSVEGSETSWLTGYFGPHSSQYASRKLTELNQYVKEWKSFCFFWSHKTWEMICEQLNYRIKDWHSSHCKSVHPTLALLVPEDCFPAAIAC